MKLTLKSVDFELKQIALHNVGELQFNQLKVLKAQRLTFLQEEGNSIADGLQT